jgi:hypothetical protein
MGFYLQSVNTANPPPSPLPRKFNLAASPRTDFYAAPTAGPSFSGPVAYKDLVTASVKNARVTVILKWELDFD